PSKAVARIELAEERPSQYSQPRVGDTSCITVTSLESQANSRANNHCEEMNGVKVMCRDRDSIQKIKSGTTGRIVHGRQSNELFDGGSPQPGPDAIVDATSMSFRWALRNIDAQVS